MSDEEHRGRGAFFGRLKGKPLRGGQARLFDTLLPRLKLDLASSAPDDLRTLFPVPVSAVRLEIGFGGAEHLIAEARRQPNIGFIGIEPFLNGMAKALAALAEHGLDNVRLHQGDARDVLQWLPPASLERAVLLYPDPWPKRRHRKRRFVSDETLARLAEVLRPGGEWRFATDIDDYAAWTLARVFAHPDFRWTAERADDWRRPWEDWPGTRYEAKAKAAGRWPSYLTFGRV